MASSKGRPKDKGQRREFARAKDPNPYHGKKEKKKKRKPYNRNQNDWEEY